MKIKIKKIRTLVEYEGISTTAYRLTLPEGATMVLINTWVDIVNNEDVWIDFIVTEEIWRDYEAGHITYFEMMRTGLPKVKEEYMPS